MCFISINSVSCIGKFNNHTCMDSYMVQMKILKMSEIKTFNTDHLCIQRHCVKDAEFFIEFETDDTVSYLIQVCNTHRDCLMEYWNDIT